jgi:hypothetical protein
MTEDSTAFLEPLDPPTLEHPYRDSSGLATWY